jgi:hypothetical protein
VRKLFNYNKKTDKFSFRGKDTYLEFTRRVVWWKNTYNTLLNYEFVTNGQVIINKKYFSYDFVTKNIEASTQLLQLKNLDANFFNLFEDLHLTAYTLYCSVRKMKAHKLSSGQYINDAYIDLFKSEYVIAKPLGKDVLSPVVFVDKRTNDIVTIVATIEVL